ncbi:MAG: hypothetical protein M1836_001700 [Candelina mexicana]|nr:MAG: hypothetical protein M1836_001700 [Candelina mexicana]
MGSIINNVVGFKPTRGLVRTDSAIPNLKRQDIIGTLTRSVKDAANMLSNMAGRSELDPITWQIPFKSIPDFTTYCKGTDLKGVTIGVPRNTFNDSSCLAPIMDWFESALRTLRSAGANVIDSTDFPAADEFKKLNQQVKGIVRASEFKRDIVEYLATLETNPNDIHAVEDRINFTKTSPAEGYAKTRHWEVSLDSGGRD